MFSIRNDSALNEYCSLSKAVCVHRNLQNQMQIPQQQPSGKYTVQLQRIAAIHTSKTERDSLRIVGTCKGNYFKLIIIHSD